MQRQNQFKKDKFGHIVGRVGKEDEVKTSNVFGLLEQYEAERQYITTEAQISESIKYQVNKSVGKSGIEQAAEKQLNQNCSENQN